MVTTVILVLNLINVIINSSNIFPIPCPLLTSSAPAMSSMALTAGKTNVSIGIYFDAGGMKVVQREYVMDARLPSETDFLSFLAALGSEGLVHSPGRWSYSTHNDLVTIINPYEDIVNRDLVDKSALYMVYKQTWGALQRLFMNNRLILADLHEDNLIVCAAEGTVCLIVIDGKLAGPTTDPSIARRRLRTKLHYAEHPYHKWLLQEYLALIEDSANFNHTW